jgi:hypothetical protein
VAALIRGAQDDGKRDLCRNSIMKVRHWLMCALVAIAMIAASGCIPDRIVWLPDSSAFVYIGTAASEPPADRSAELLLYDLSRKRSRPLTNRPVLLMTAIPGISPDGKQVAVVEFGHSAGNLTIRAVIIDVETGLADESKPFPFAKIEGEEAVPLFSAAAVEWSRRGDRLLIGVFASPDARKPALTPCIYDPKAKNLMILSDCLMTPLDRALNGSIAADGSGFLAFDRRMAERLTTASDHETKGVNSRCDAFYRAIVFIDWRGRRHEFNLTQAALAAMTDGRDEDFGTIARDQTPGDTTLQGWWEGPVAVLPLARGIARLDCARRTISYQADAAVSDEHDRRERFGVDIARRFAGGDVMVEFIAAIPASRGTDGGVCGQIVVWTRRDNRQTVLVDRASEVSTSVSPDGKKLAIGYCCGDPVERRILVLGETGAPIVDVLVEKRKAPNAEAPPLAVEPTEPLPPLPAELLELGARRAD